jgi:hypothetical protein
VSADIVQQLAAPDRDGYDGTAAAKIDCDHPNDRATDTHDLRAIEAHLGKQIGESLDVFSGCREPHYQTSIESCRGTRLDGVGRRTRRRVSRDPGRSHECFIDAGDPV